jgi:P-type Cu2+ transporter
VSEAVAHLHWQREPGHEQAEFFAEGMRCANCAGAIRKRVGALPGVQQVTVNLTTARVSVGWDPERARLGAILDAVRQLGFQPVPLSGAAVSDARLAERRRMLKRIGLAGLAATQMSMYTVGLYAGALTGIDPWIEKLLRVTAMLISVPVMFYSGAPFLLGAWRDLRRHSLGMDVPVAAALLLAFSASVVNTLRGGGEVYFDSVAMFIFFLLAGRYLEMKVRLGSLNASEALVRSLPSQVTRLRAEGGSERIALGRVVAGDRLLVALGAVIPVDGVLEGATLVDESLLTGEAAPVARGPGSEVAGGAINTGTACVVRASRDASHSTLASMAALIERAQSERPPQALAADRAASQFVSWIVLLSVLVAAAWLWIDPARAFPATLAVLVATCPCALSLATPVAIAAATARLARRGVLTTRANALERLAAVDTVVLDKTGTLTTAQMRLGAVQCLGPDTPERCLAIAASLEQHSAHPLATAFTGATGAGVAVTEVEETAGQGLEGKISGRRWRIGRRDYVAAIFSPELAPDGVRVASAAATPGATDDRVWLGRAAGPAAAFTVTDTPRADAAEAVAALRALGLDVVVASGDRQSVVAHLAAELGITRASGRMDPQAKLALVRELQARGHRVLMVGDGINDGPVLAAAHASCAIGAGAALAHAASDLLLMNESLAALATAVDTARGAARLVRANLRWALGYNLCAVPLAAAGLVSPWVAALGMSASSLFVVVRAGRFAERGRQP